MNLHYLSFYIFILLFFIIIIIKIKNKHIHSHIDFLTIFTKKLNVLNKKFRYDFG